MYLYCILVYRSVEGTLTLKDIEQLSEQILCHFKILTGITFYLLHLYPYVYPCFVCII